MPDAPVRLFLGLLLFVMLLALACETRSGVKQAFPAWDLTERFDAVRNAAPTPAGGASFVRHYEVVRNGDRRDAMLLVAPVEVRARLMGISGRVFLEGFATPVFNIGDGIQMEVFIVDSHGRTRVLDRYFDAGRRAQDRAWIPLEIPIDFVGTTDEEIEIRVSAGVKGDLVADWLALSSIRLARKGSVQ